MSANTYSRTILHVAIAIIKQQGCYLITQRHSHVDHGGRWEFPGGKREPNESWETCLRREIWEELGIHLKTVRPYGLMRDVSLHRIIIFRLFFCTIAAGKPKPLDAQDLRWVKPEHLNQYPFPPANTRLIQRLVRDAQSQSASRVTRAQEYPRGRCMR